MGKRFPLRQRATGGGAGGKNGGKKSRSDNAPINLKWKDRDEEISSDEDDEDGAAAPEESSSDDDEKYETVEEKRRRMAKEFLEKMKKSEDDDEHNEDEEDDGFDAHISERLKKERLQSVGKYYRDLGEQFAELDVSEMDVRHCYGHSNAITCLALTTDEKLVFTGSKDNSVMRWNTETGQKEEMKRKWGRTVDGDVQSHEGEILSIAVSTDSRFVVSGSKDSLIRVYDQRMKYSEVHVFRGHRGAVSALAFQAGTHSLISGSHDRCLKYWDLNEMAYIETMFGHQDYVFGLDCWHKLRPVTVSNDRTVRTWKVQDGSHLVFRGHKAPIDTVQILTDDTYVSGCQDGKLCLWKEAKKHAVSTVEHAHGMEDNSSNARWITSLASIKASDTFATGSNDGFVRIWSAKNDKIAAKAEIPVNGFVNGLAITSRLLVAGCGREHRLGRWWNMKKSKDRLTIMRFGVDLEDLIEQNSEEEEEDDDEDDESSMGSDEVGSSEAESDEQSEESD